VSSVVPAAVPVKSENTLDLGILEAPLLVFGGPYSNLQATRALGVEVQRRGFDPENVICTGDVVAYCADAQATVDEVRRISAHVVMGNCEESLGLEQDDCGCGFEEGSACDLLSVQWYAKASKALGNEAKAWMRSLPRTITFEMSGRSFAVIHGGAQSISKFVFLSDEERVKQEELGVLGVDAVIGGHCGLPFTQRLATGVWHNAGVIGMPANDGTPRTWFSTLTPSSEGIRFQHHALDYDPIPAARSMERKGLPEAYAKTLLDGLWPNMDVLPESERRVRGTPITPNTLLW